MPSGEFSVILTDESYPFPARDMTVSDFMRGIRRGATESKLDIGKVIVESIKFIVQGSVLRISSLCSFLVRSEPGMVTTVIEVLLRRPFAVVAEEVDLGSLRSVDRPLEDFKFLRCETIRLPEFR